jgi:hypothetical protein
MGVLVVIESSAAHVLVFHRKTEWLYQMQIATGIGR